MLVAPFPDETLYSWVARYHLLSGYRHAATTSETLFFCEKIRLHPYLPAHISALSIATGVEKEVLINAHTLYPLFSACLPSRSQKLKKKMFADDGGQAIHAAGLPNFHLKFQQGHRFCNECLVGDRKTCGVGYLHLDHQIPGVSACAVHRMRLNIVGSGDYGIDRHLILPSQFAFSQKVPTIDSDFAVFARSKLIESGVSGTFNRERYLKRMIEGGWASSSGRLSMANLVESMTEFYSEASWFTEQDCESKLRSFKFLGPMLRSKTHFESHPITHLLFDFWLTKQEGRIVTSGPHPVTPKVKSSSDESAAYQFGVQLRFPTKYIMSVLNLNAAPSEIMSVGFDILGMDAFLMLAVMGIHREKMARYLNMTIAQVEVGISKVEGLTAWRRCYRVFLKIQKSKVKISKYVELNPMASRKEIKKELPNEYFQLYRHCSSALEAILPPPEQQHDPHVDWSVRDTEVEAILMQFPDNIFELCSLSEIDTLLGGHGWLIKKSKRLPKSINLIEKRRCSK